MNRDLVRPRLTESFQGNNEHESELRRHLAASTSIASSHALHSVHQRLFASINQVHCRNARQPTKWDRLHCSHAWWHSTTPGKSRGQSVDDVILLPSTVPACSARLRAGRPSPHKHPLDIVGIAGATAMSRMRLTSRAATARNCCLLE